LIQDDVRRVSDDQLSNPRLGPDPAQVRMISKGFDQSDDPRGESLGCSRFVAGNVSVNLP